MPNELPDTAYSALRPVTGCGRTFDLSKKFLPDRLSKVASLEFLSAHERRLLSQVLVERYISAKVLALSREHWLG